MNASDHRALRAVGKFWLTMGAWVAGVFIVVGGSMMVMMLWISAKAAGLVWCAIMVLGIIAFFSWLVYDETNFWKDR